MFVWYQIIDINGNVMEYTTNYNSGVIFSAEGWFLMFLAEMVLFWKVSFWRSLGLLKFSASTFWLMRLSPRVQDDPCEAVEQCPDFFWHLKRWSPDFVGKFLLKLLRFGAKSNPVSAESVEAGFMLASIAPREGWMLGDSVVQQKCKHTSTSSDKNGDYHHSSGQEWIWRFKPMIYRFRVVVSRFSTGRKLSDLNLQFPGCSESCFSS